MRVRVRPLPFLAFFVVASILGSIRGLAGPLSRAAAVLPLALAGLSLVQLVATWFAFGFHEEFSNDHPAKGDVVRYALHVRNGLCFPASSGLCRFASLGPFARRLGPFPIELRSRGEAHREAEIACSYRGVYVIGARSFSFHGVLGIIEIDHIVEPRFFHVYPELVKLGPRIDKLAESGGEDRASSSGGSEDPTVFEGLKPLSDGRGGRRIAWKRWASLGIPCEAIEGRSSAYGLRVVLDLRPPNGEGEDRLAAEDLAVSAVYSVLLRLVEARIPTELVLGGEDSGFFLDDRASFDAAYAASTSVLFTDPRFPAAAFSAGRASLLVTTRPIALADSSGDERDIFGALEAARSRLCAVTVFSVPPPSLADREQSMALAAVERLGGDPRFPPLRVLDPRRGLEDLIHAFGS